MQDILLVILIVFNIYILVVLRKEQKRTMALTVFVDALVRYASKIPDMIYEIKDNKDKKYELELQANGHKIIYKDIEDSFLYNFYYSKISEFIRKNENLFNYKSLFSGLNTIYSDIIARVKKSILEKEKKDKI